MLCTLLVYQPDVKALQSSMLHTTSSVLGRLALLASLALADGSTQLLVPGLCCPFVYATCSSQSVVDTLFCYHSHIRMQTLDATSSRRCLA